MATLGEIAAWVEGEPASASYEVGVLRVSDLENAGRDAVVFAVDPKALAEALETEAGLILANRKLKQQTNDMRVLWVGDARYGFAVLAQRLMGRGFTAGVHPTAILGEAVEIGEGSCVGPGVIVGDGVRIGRECNLVANATIYRGVTLGD